MSELSVRGLCYRHNGPLDFTLAGGTCACLSGASGSGKTLLLRALADLDAHAGEIRLDGQDCRQTPPALWRKQVGLLPAESPWWFDSVGEHFSGDEQPPFSVLGFTEQVLQWQVHRLSSGERQRLALLRLLANRPRVLLLDEPTANLDISNTRRVESLLENYRQESGAALLWVSHDPEQVRRVADIHWHLADGALRALPLEKAQ